MIKLEHSRGEIEVHGHLTDFVIERVGLGEGETQLVFLGLEEVLAKKGYFE